MEMAMDADRQDKHDAMHRHELALQNGKANDDAYKTGVLVDLCRAFKTLMATDFVKPPDLDGIEERIVSKVKIHCEKVHKGRKSLVTWEEATLILALAAIVMKAFLGQ